VIQSLKASYTRGSTRGCLASSTDRLALEVGDPVDPCRAVAAHAVLVDAAPGVDQLPFHVLREGEGQAHAHDAVLLVVEGHLLARLKLDVEVQHPRVGGLAVEGHLASLDEPHVPLRAYPVVEQRQGPSIGAVGRGPGLLDHDEALPMFVPGMGVVLPEVQRPTRRGRAHLLVPDVQSASTAKMRKGSRDPRRRELRMRPDFTDGSVTGRR
jgi:hypothetical protein